MFFGAEPTAIQIKNTDSIGLFQMPPWEAGKRADQEDVRADVSGNQREINYSNLTTRVERGDLGDFGFGKRL